MAVRSGRTAENLDVSGSLPIRERPKIGKLLSLEFLDEWDVLIIYRLDRGFRNHCYLIGMPCKKHQIVIAIQSRSAV
jgi:hypothetical protein